jgi:peptidylprolyl isomerase
LDRPCIPEIEYPIGQDLRLTIESPPAEGVASLTLDQNDSSDEHKLNTLSAMFAALRGCWVPPPVAEAHHGMQMSVRLSFKRTGEIIGAPRVTYTSPNTPPEVRDLYHQAITAARAQLLCRSTTGLPRWTVAGPRSPSFLAEFGRTPMTEGTMILKTARNGWSSDRRSAPGHVARIGNWCDGFYDGSVFHRVIDGFMAQTGCPQGTGMGGSGKKLKAEFSKEKHVRGTASMARAQSPDSGDSQFFICFDDATFLDNQYTVWGKVTEGMDNVDKIKRGEPVQSPDKIVSAKMAADAA